MPATAAIDNETLDHLLSVVDDSHNLSGIRRLSKSGRPAEPAARIPVGQVLALQASAAAMAVCASFLVL